MHDGAAAKGQQGMLALADRIDRQAVALVLVPRTFGGLGEVGLEFHRCHRQAVQEQAEVDGEVAARMVFQLRHHAQDVGRIAV